MIPWRNNLTNKLYFFFPFILYYDSVAGWKGHVLRVLFGKVEARVLYCIPERIYFLHRYFDGFSFLNSASIVISLLFSKMLLFGYTWMGSGRPLPRDCPGTDTSYFVSSIFLKPMWRIVERAIQLGRYPVALLTSDRLHPGQSALMKIVIFVYNAVIFNYYLSIWQQSRVPFYRIHSMSQLKLLVFSNRTSSNGNYTFNNFRPSFLFTYLFQLFFYLSFFFLLPLLLPNIYLFISF